MYRASAMSVSTFAARRHCPHATLDGTLFFELTSPSSPLSLCFLLRVESNGFPQVKCLDVIA